MARPKEHKDLHDRLDELVTNGMEKTGRWVSLWIESMQYFFSDQLRGVKQKDNWDWVVINYIWPSAMQEIAKLSRNDPKINVQPWSNDDMEWAKMWQSSLNWQWKHGMNRRGMRLEQINALLDRKMYGYSVSHFFWRNRDQWDYERQVWEGDVGHKLWHPAYFWADDEEDIQKGNCGTKRYVRLDWAKAQWPDFADSMDEIATSVKDPVGGWAYCHIRGSASGTMEASGTGDADKIIERGKNINALLGVIQQSEPYGKVEGKEKYVCLEQIWHRDYKEEETKEEEIIPLEELKQTGQAVEEGGVYTDPDGMILTSETWPRRIRRTYKKPLYPDGRFSMRITGNDKKHILLHDQAWNFRQWPFIVTPHYLLPHMWQGIDSVQMYKTVQDMLNISCSHLYNNMKQYGDPKVEVDPNAVENPAPKNKKKGVQIGAGAGSVIVTKPGRVGTAVRFIDPPAVSAGATQLYGLFAQEFKNLFGLQSISRGEKDEGRMTATQARWLAITANDRISLQSIYEDLWVKECAQWMAMFMQTYYEPGRMLRIVGQDNQLGVVEFSQKMKDIRFDLDVERGSTLPYDEEQDLQKKMMAYQLVAQGPHPMLADMLRQLGISNWREIVAQTPGMQQFQQLMQLKEGVASGEIPIQEAAKLILQETVKGRDNAEGVRPVRSERRQGANQGS